MAPLLAKFWPWRNKYRHEHSMNENIERFKTIQQSFEIDVYKPIQQNFEIDV